MSLLLIALAVVAAVLSDGEDWFVPAIVNAVLAFWSNGVVLNYGRHDAQEMPNWAPLVATVTAIAAAVFLVLALV